MADGVVVGSALIDTMAAALEAGGPLNDGVEKAVALLGSIRTGIDNM
jgi:tryptophan synthase alpha subunit